MKKILIVFVFLGFTFTSGLCIKQKAYDTGTRSDMFFCTESIKDSSLNVADTLYKMIQGTWVNINPKDERDGQLFKISGDVMSYWYRIGSGKEEYKIKISEDSTIGGVQIINGRYKPKIMYKQQILKLTEDSLVFSHAHYYRRN